MTGSHACTSHAASAASTLLSSVSAEASENARAISLVLPLMDKAILQTATLHLRVTTVAHAPLKFDEAASMLRVFEACDIQRRGALTQKELQRGMRSLSGRDLDERQLYQLSAALLLLKPEASEQPLSPLDAAGIAAAARRAVFRLRLLRLHWLVVGVAGVAVALQSD